MIGLPASRADVSQAENTDSDSTAVNKRGYRQRSRLMLALLTS